MDIGKTLNHLLDAPVLYRDASSYERLVETWEDARPIPTLEELNAAWPAAEVKSVALKNIQQLEHEISPRRLREAVLTLEGKTWMENQEALIAAERAKL